MSIINRETDYAIRILRSIAHDNVTSVQAISEEQNIAKSFAHKIIKKLEKSEFVKITRGPGGGIRLNCDLSGKSLYDLIICVDNVLYVNDCQKPGYKCEFKDCDNCKSHLAFSKWQSHLDTQLMDMKLNELI